MTQNRERNYVDTPGKHVVCPPNLSVYSGGLQKTASSKKAENPTISKPVKKFLSTWYFSKFPPFNSRFARTLILRRSLIPWKLNPIVQRRAISIMDLVHIAVLVKKSILSRIPQFCAPLLVCPVYNALPGRKGN